MTEENQELTAEVSANDMINIMKSQGQSKYATEKALSTVTKVGSYLPYIQLMGSNSKVVKRKQFPMGNFALVENKVNHDLGDSFVAYLISWRPKAMQYAPTVQSYFDTESEAFKAVEAKADTKDSNCGFGAEFLLWLPDSRKLATLFLGNKTGRNEAPNLIACIESGVHKCRINAELIEDKKNDRDWHGAKLFPYDLDIKVFPSPDELKEQLEKFNNPPAATSEPSEKDEETNERG